MSNILILHHFESIWSKELTKFNRDIDTEVFKVLDFLKHEEIDEVIITRFGEQDFENEHAPIINYCNQSGIRIKCYEYGYNWRKDEYTDESIYPENELNKTWCQGQRTTHSKEDILEIHDWQKELKRNNNYVYLAGAFVDECLNDMETILETINVEFENIEGLCTGDYCEYDFQGHNPIEITLKIQTIINTIDQAISQRCNEVECGYYINELVEYDPAFVLSKLESFNEDIMNLVEEICELDIDVSSEYEELDTLFEHIRDYEYEDEDLIDNIKNKIKQELFTIVKKPEDISQTVYHGTTWKIENNDINMHTDIERNFSATGAIFVSNKESVAEHFVDWASGDAPGVRVVFKIELELETVIEWDSNSEDRLIDVNGIEYDIAEDREQMYKELDSEFDAINIKYNYPAHDDGDDIAYLNDIAENEIISGKALINGKWTEHLSINDLKNTVTTHLKKMNKKNIKNKIK
jgi:hypothetical protein